MTSQALAPINKQHMEVLSTYNPEEIELVKNTVAKGCNDLQLAFFLYTARARGLNPFARQIYAILRKQGEQTLMVIQTGIDGYRSIASRSGAYAGTDLPEFGPMHKDGVVEYPEWAKVTTYRIVQGVRVPFVGYCEWSEFKQSFNGRLGDMWAKMPKNQLAKCAEAQALRKGFPEELQDVEFAAEPEPDIIVGNTSPIYVPYSGQPQDDEDPLLKACELHEAPFFKSRGMQTFSHPIGDTGKWCNRPGLLNQLLVDASNKLKWDNKALQEWTKEHWGKVRSAMSDEELVTAIRSLRGKAEAQTPEAPQQPTLDGATADAGDDDALGAELEAAAKEE